MVAPRHLAVVMGRHELDQQPRRRPAVSTVVMVLITVALIAAGAYAVVVSQQGNDPGHVYPSSTH